MEYSDKQIEQLLKDMYDGKYSSSDNLPKDLYEAIADYYKRGVYKGFGGELSDFKIGTKDYELLNELRTNTYMFSAAKVYQQTGAFEQLVADSKDFKEYYENATKLYDQYNKEWAKTEYNTCIGQAATAQQWNEIEKQKELFPYLRYNAVMDANTSDICAPLNGTTLPVNDSFWSIYMPLNHFNCRCVVEQVDKYEDVQITSKEAVADATKEVSDKMQDAFKMNPGKDGYIFKKDHPYFEVAPKDKGFAKENFGLEIPDND